MALKVLVRFSDEDFTRLLSILRDSVKGGNSGKPKKAEK